MIYLYLRCTEDWANVTCEALGKKRFKKDGVSIFNKAFDLDWFEYRRRFKEIATSMWRSPHVSSSCDFLNDDDWLLPTDDDDWHHPSIIEKIGQISGYDYICWDAYTIKMVQNHGIYLYELPKRESIASNAYAIRVGFLKNLHTLLILNAHNDSRHLALQAGGRILDWRGSGALSAYFWHLGSISFLNRIQREGLSRHLRKFIPVNKPIKIKSHQQWLEPGYSQIVSLTKLLCGPRMFL